MEIRCVGETAVSLLDARSDKRLSRQLAARALRGIRRSFV